MGLKTLRTKILALSMREVSLDLSRLARLGVASVITSISQIPTEIQELITTMLSFTHFQTLSPFLGSSGDHSSSHQREWTPHEPNPIDRGRDAWTVLIAGFIIEALFRGMCKAKKQMLIAFGY
ncbi:hypothetical protein F4810DRAFT_558227 [Camillea tinctor]|nr:hypothetical protein F4810DRAFT_558227 [Camillea tinctor]